MGAQVTHLKQLKALLGPAMELQWIAPSTNGGSRSSSATCVKDLDLGARFVATAPTTSAATPPVTPQRGRSPARVPESPSATGGRTGSEGPPRSPRPLGPGSSLKNSAARTLLLERFAAHIAAAEPSDAENSESQRAPQSLNELLSQPTFSAAAVPPLPEAPLPVRPTSVPQGLSSSRGATPVRVTAASPSLHTPSPSLRRAHTTVSLATPQSHLASPSKPPAPLFATPAADTPIGVPPSPAPSRAMPPPTSVSDPENPAARTARRLQALANSSSNSGGEGAAAATPGKRKRSAGDGDVLQTPPRRAALAAGLMSPPAKTPCSAPRRLVLSTPARAASCSAAATPSRSAAGSAATTPVRPAPSPLATPARRAVCTPIAEAVSADTGGRSTTPHATPLRRGGATSVNVTPTVTPQRPSQSPASRHTFYEAPPKFAVKADLFAGKLPHMTVRTPTTRKPGASTPGSAASHHSRGGDAGTRRRLDFPVDAAAAGTPTRSPFARARRPAADAAAADGGTPTRSPFARPRRPAAERAVAAAAAAAAAELDEPAAAADAAPTAAMLSRAVHGSMRSAAAAADAPSPPAFTTAAAAPAPPVATDATMLAASILDGDMLSGLQRNADRTAATAAAASPRARRAATEAAARKRLPSLFEQLRQLFQRRGSLRLSRAAVVSAILDMNLAAEGMTEADAAVHLALLARAVPEWITVDEAQVSIDRMCTGVRQRLDDVAHGYAHV